ncbi:TPA: hypothetical protein LU109_003608 [Enterobacter hormaechei subsp. xiangfangensis]|nr:hypothetical protein [Enterobacter hormaechei subsp. xiangfangensis]
MFAKKYHFFYASFVERNGHIKGVALRLSVPYVNDAALAHARLMLDMDDNAPAVSVSYLGEMTLKQWNASRV